MKPHIKKLDDKYICHIVIDGVLYLSIGDTIKQAYLNWKRDILL